VGEGDAGARTGVGGWAAALGHDAVHGLDITLTLGLGRRVPEERLRIVLGTASPRSTRFFGARPDGVRLRADDLDRSYGSGSVLTGTAQDLLVLLFGRKVPPGRLESAASGRFPAARTLSVRRFGVSASAGGRRVHGRTTRRARRSSEGGTGT
jgi:hypothetical protein